MRYLQRASVPCEKWTSLLNILDWSHTEWTKKEKFPQSLESLKLLEMVAFLDAVTTSPIQTTLIFFVLPVHRKSNPWSTFILRFPLVPFLNPYLMHRIEVCVHIKQQFPTCNTHIQGGVRRLSNEEWEETMSTVLIIFALFFAIYIFVNIFNVYDILVQLWYRYKQLM